MKGSKAILALAAIVLVLGASMLWAQDEYAKSLDKVIKPGQATVKFDTYVYTFVAENCLSVRFEKLDRVHVRLEIKPMNYLTPVQSVFLQWGPFPPRELTLDSSGGETFILNTETGYAEK